MLTLFAEQDFAAGVPRDSPEVDLVGTKNGLHVRMDRTGLAALPKEHVADLELWVDDGAGGWRFDRSWQIAGGEAKNPRTGEVVHFNASGYFPPKRTRVRLRCARAFRASVAAEQITVPEPSVPDAHHSVAHVGANMWEVEGATGATQSITIGSESNRSLYGFTGVDDNEDLDPTALVTWNTSESLTQLQYLLVDMTGSQDLHGFVHRRKNPTAATANLVWAGMLTAHRWVHGYAYASDVDQTTPEGTIGTNTGTAGDTHTGSCTGVANGMSYGFCFVLRSGGSAKTITDAGGQTATAEFQGTARVLGSIARISGSGSNSYSWDTTGDTIQGWGVIATPINPTAAAGTAVPVFYHHMQTQGMA